MINNIPILLIIYLMFVYHAKLKRKYLHFRYFITGRPLILIYI